MSIRIAVAGQKGGSKKSATIRALAAAYSSANLRVLIVDLDRRQRTCTKWNERRQARFPNLPSIDAKTFASVPQAMREEADYDVVLFDPGAFASELMVEAAAQAHCVIIPTGLCLDDLEPSVDLANDLAQRQVDPQRIVFALHPAGDSQSELNAARDYLGHTDYVTLDGYVPHLTIYSKAHDLGLSIIEARSPMPRKKAETMIQSAVDAISALSN